MLRRLVPIVTLATIASLAAVACGGDGDEETPTPPPAAGAPTPPPAATAVAATPTAPAQAGAPAGGKLIDVLNRDAAGSGVYAFEPAELTFDVGETVTFNLIAETELHSFTVDELGIDMDIDASTNPGATGTLTHTFDKAGTFRLVCIYHEGNGMVGTITVR